MGPRARAISSPGCNGGGGKRGGPALRGEGRRDAQSPRISPTSKIPALREEKIIGDKRQRGAASAWEKKRGKKMKT